MQKMFALADVKATDGSSPNGEFEVILSAPTLDRDGEVIDGKAFDPLPDSIPFHAFHDFTDPIGRAEPFYDGEVLKAKGFYASTARAQEVRALVADGVIRHTSVGFMAAKRTVKDGTPHIEKAELLEGSMVSVPSNREAAVLVAKSFQGEKDRDRKAIAGSFEERRDQIRDAVRAAHPDAWWSGVVATFEDTVVYEVETPDGAEQFRATYEINDGVVTLGTGEPVEVTEVVLPKSPATTPEGKAAAPADAGAAAPPPADVTVGMARLAALRAEAEVLLATT